MCALNRGSQGAVVAYVRTVKTASGAGLDSTGIGGGPLEIVGSRACHLWDALCRTYQALRFGHVLGGDEVLRDLVLARIIEPTSKEDSATGAR